MRWGLEARAPFLDSRIIAFAQALNTEQKITLTNTKVFLKESLKDVLPQSVLTRKKKGFQVPLAQWFRGPMKAQFEERCLDPQNKITGIVNQKEIVQLLKENSDGTDHGNRLWMLYSLATWLENNK